MSIQLNDLITLTKGSDKLTGRLIYINNSPEKLANKPITDVRQIPDGTTGTYLSVQIAGYKTIVIKVDISISNKNSPILSDTLGITYYIIDNAIYTIQEVILKDDKVNTAFITLVNNHQNVADPNNPVIPSKDISIVIKDVLNVIPNYTLTSIVKGSTVIFTPTITTTQPQVGTYKAKFQVYKYSDDDVYLTNLINFIDTDNYPIYYNFTLTQNYTRDNVNWAETWDCGATVAQIDLNKPHLITNDTGVIIEIVEYTITAQSMNRYLATV